MIVNAHIGQKILATIGRPGQRPDINDAVIVDTPERVKDEKGRTVYQAAIIEVTKTLAGEKYLRPRVQNLFFAFARETRNDLLDDMSPEQLVNKQSADQMARLLSLPEAGQVADVDDLLAELAAEPAAG